MESWLYPATIVVLLILAYLQWQNNAKKTVIAIMAILVYIVYSHETGESLTKLKNEAVDSFDDAVGNSKYKERVVTPGMRPVESEEMVNQSGSDVTRD